MHAPPLKNQQDDCGCSGLNNNVLKAAYCRVYLFPKASLGHESSTLSQEKYGVSGASTSTCPSSHVLNARCMSTLQFDRRDSRKADLLLTARSCSTVAETRDSFDVLFRATVPTPATSCPAFFTSIFLLTSFKFSCTSIHFFSDGLLALRDVRTVLLDSAPGDVLPASSGPCRTRCPFLSPVAQLLFLRAAAPLNVAIERVLNLPKLGFSCSVAVLRLERFCLVMQYEWVSRRSRPPAKMSPLTRCCQASPTCGVRQCTTTALAASWQ